jgi:hypothetical protein
MLEGEKKIVLSSLKNATHLNFFFLKKIKLDSK